MMGGYYSLGEVYDKEKNYDSAIHYYSSFLKELEPSDIYYKESFLTRTYKALVDCYQDAGDSRLHQLLGLIDMRIMNAGDDAGQLLEILETDLMAIRQDSVNAKYALPLARRIQTMPSPDPYIKIFAVDDEFLILKKLKRTREAMQVLERYHAKNPVEPLILSEMGWMKILANENKSALAYLQQSKQNLNTYYTKQDFNDLLNKPDFDIVRNTQAFKKLI